MTEIDMSAYHSDDDKIEPGKHKTFDIGPTIASFAQRFTGESPESFKSASDVPYFDPRNMPAWWVRQTNPSLKNWPGEGPSYTPEPMPGLMSPLGEEPYPRYMPMSMKETPGGPKMPDVGDTASGPFRGGGASGDPVIAPNYKYFSKEPYQDRPVEIVPDEPVVERAPHDYPSDRKSPTPSNNPRAKKGEGKRYLEDKIRRNPEMKN